MKLPELKEGMIIKCLTSSVPQWTEGKEYLVFKTNGKCLIITDTNNARFSNDNLSMVFEVIEPSSILIIVINDLPLSMQSYNPIPLAPPTIPSAPIVPSSILIIAINDLPLSMQSYNPIPPSAPIAPSYNSSPQISKTMIEVVTQGEGFSVVKNLITNGLHLLDLTLVSVARPTEKERVIFETFIKIGEKNPKESDYELLGLLYTKSVLN